MVVLSWLFLSPPHVPLMDCLGPTVGQFVFLAKGDSHQMLPSGGLREFTRGNR